MLRVFTRTFRFRTRLFPSFLQRTDFIFNPFLEKFFLLLLDPVRSTFLTQYDKQPIMPTANFTPTTSLSLGEITIICSFPRDPLRAILRVNAFLSRPLMVHHFLLSLPFRNPSSPTAHQETASQTLSFFTAYMVLFNNCDTGSP